MYLTPHTFIIPYQAYLVSPVLRKCYCRGWRDYLVVKSTAVIEDPHMIQMVLHVPL